MAEEYILAIIAVFIWIGFVGAISFMEAWLKFKAPGVTVPLGLGIGRLVFNALNKMEWLFALCIALNVLLVGGEILKIENLLYIVPVILLLIQTIRLLPALDRRAEMHIQGQTVPASNLHFYYVGMEAVKITCLCIFGIQLIK